MEDKYYSNVNPRKKNTEMKTCEDDDMIEIGKETWIENNYNFNPKEI